MIGERTNEGWELQLTSQGVGRYLSAAFLAFWLCIWAVGESVVLWIVVVGAIALLTGRPPEPGREPLELGPAVMAGAFFVVWLTMWTVGGIAAFLEEMRLLWGRDRIVVSSGRLSVTWRRGPFRRTRTFERDAVRRIVVAGRNDHLMLETSRERVELSGLGSRAERIDAVNALRGEMGIAEESSDAGQTVPRGWEVIITPEGERALTADTAMRRAQAKFASVVTMALAAVTLVLARESVHHPEILVGAFLAFALTLALAAGTLWLVRGRLEWRIGTGRLTLRKRYGPRVRDVFEARRLVIDSSSDSDGDRWYELYALGDAQEPARPAAARWHLERPRNSRSVARVMDDASAVRDLGAWLAREAGLELKDRSTPEAQALQLAELRAMLESSGRFGQWAAKWADRLGRDRKKAG